MSDTTSAPHDAAQPSPESGCSPWHPASEPPEKDEWVIVSADGMVRCVAWNNAVKQWQDWSNSGMMIERIEWWMSIPPLPSENDGVKVANGGPAK